MTIRNTLRTIESQNVVAKLEGSDPAAQGRVRRLHRALGSSRHRAADDGDSIYNGAQDNASGVGGLLEIARAFTKTAAPPKRSILFLAVTAEEQGLLGSQYYARDADLSAREDGGRHQHGRPERARAHEGPDARRLRRLRSRRLRARRRRRAGARRSRRRRAGEGLLLPVGSLQLREAGRAGARSGRGRRLHRQAGRLRPEGARRVDRARLPQTRATS